MEKRSGFLFSLTALIICLCLGSLLLTMNVLGSSAMGIFELESEDHNLFDQAEYDDEFFIVAIAGGMIANLISSAFRSGNLGFQIACISPVSPPPKYS